MPSLRFLTGLFGGGGGSVSSSTNKPPVGATVVTGQVPAGATATCKKNGVVLGAATVTPQGAASYTLSSPLVLGDQVSFPWSLTGESSAAIVTVAPPPAPVNTAAPVISGTAQVGQTLAASPGSWANSPTSYAYAFAVGGVQVQSGSSNAYAPQAADVGKAITVTVTATNAGGSISAASAATSSVTAAPMALQALALTPATATAGSTWSATISGKTAGSSIAAMSNDGSTLTVSGSTVSGTFGAAGSPTVTLAETLAGATNSPKSTAVQVTVSAASSGAPSSGALDFSDPTNSGLHPGL